MSGPAVTRPSTANEGLPIARRAREWPAVVRRHSPEVGADMHTEPLKGSCTFTKSGEEADASRTVTTNGFPRDGFPLLRATRVRGPRTAPLKAEAVRYSPA